LYVDDGKINKRKVNNGGVKVFSSLISYNDNTLTEYRKITTYIYIYVSESEREERETENKDQRRREEI